MDDVLQDRGKRRKRLDMAGGHTGAVRHWTVTEKLSNVSGVFWCLPPNNGSPSPNVRRPRAAKLASQPTSPQELVNTCLSLSRMALTPYQQQNASRPRWVVGSLGAASENRSGPSTPLTCRHFLSSHQAPTSHLLAFYETSLCCSDRE